MVVGVEDGLIRVADSQVLGAGLVPPLTVKWEDSWIRIPALESVPVLGALQKAPQR